MSLEMDNGPWDVHLWVTGSDTAWVGGRDAVISQLPGVFCEIR